MARPRRFRRISQEPQIRCFKPERDDIDNLDSIEILIDEFEAIRLRDYHDIQQKRSAEIMGVSQPTFHRILNSARKKIADALINGNPLVIVGRGHLITYECKDCGFEWQHPHKEYEKCPDCASSNIIQVEEEYSSESEEFLLQRRSYGGRGVGAGPPTVCRCPNCGYESPKELAVPCSNTKCPKCETPLCGDD
ncbi:DUF134 domain-containing protein [Methanobacterium ferruginis]|jgi:predicted DNA-binding protein (UPF0251 family)|uniref:DUF134 domain-containing protein n=1 Tax=Methanobacterium ferruginis TaxID=710191 RepID=UPI002572911B|nr:DUF134 domain-containing protein [Methanobacterium ferruginis]MCC7551468.1 DUF134 domain-containing protein [Methanobacterium sp.]BDZ66736.1 hypothetical protein GCM10025860_01840 [Methanobacterium ferruginis]